MLRVIIFSFIVSLASGQTCSTSNCSLACNEYQTVINHCAYDYQPNDNIYTCLCKYAGGLQTNFDTLAQCVVCDQNGLASSDLSNFQIDAVICGNYLQQGEAAALSIASMQASDVVAYFSTSALAGLQSTVCGAARSESTIPPIASGSSVSGTKPAGGGAATSSGRGMPILGSTSTPTATESGAAPAMSSNQAGVPKERIELAASAMGFVGLMAAAVL